MDTPAQSELFGYTRPIRVVWIHPLPKIEVRRKKRKNTVLFKNGQLGVRVGWIHPTDSSCSDTPSPGELDGYTRRGHPSNLPCICLVVARYLRLSGSRAAAGSVK